MKDANVVKGLKKAAQKFQAVKKFKPAQLLEQIVNVMEPIGGMTGLNVASNQTLTLVNHTDSYCLPIVFEEHGGGMSSFAKRAYAFFETLMDYLLAQGVSPSDIQYHLGADYSSKHHDPTK